MAAVCPGVQPVSSLVVRPHSRSKVLFPLLSQAQEAGHAPAVRHRVPRPSSTTPPSERPNGFIECGHCQRMFIMQHVAQSNLILLVSDALLRLQHLPPGLPTSQRSQIYPSEHRK
ncbi:uncharacterized protein ACNLHF_016572 [Anomaloglossus baeobatrachus]